MEHSATMSGSMMLERLALAMGRVPISRVVCSPSVYRELHAAALDRRLPGGISDLFGAPIRENQSLPGSMAIVLGRAGQIEFVDLEEK